MDQLSHNEQDRELSTREAAALLNLSPMTLKKWRCTHEHPELPWYKRFGKVFHLESEVTAFRQDSNTNSQQRILI
ncbi:MAG: hypothetical protein R3F50_17520 [Gammaproteobacteria bacterium]